MSGRKTARQVLIVEDEPTAATYLAKILSDAGYHIVGPASSLDSALSLAAKHAPHLAFIHVKLSEGSNGIILGRSLKSLFGTGIVFTTADEGLLTKEIASRNASDVGFGHIIKPFIKKTVIEAVRYTEIALQDKKALAPPKNGFKPWL